MYAPLKKSLNNKRREISSEFRDQIVGLLDAFEAGDHVQIHPNDFFGYRKVTVERPLLDGNGEEVKGRDGTILLKAFGVLVLSCFDCHV